MPNDDDHDSSSSCAARAAMFHAFSEQSTQFAALLALDGTILEVNRQALGPWGYRRADVLGRHLWEGGWWRGSPELVEQVRAGVAQAACGSVFLCDLPYFGADGSRGHADVVIAPLLGVDGSVACLSATGSNGTERKRVEDRLPLLDEIGEATRIALDATTIMEGATRLLGEHLGATRVAYADLEPDNDLFAIRHDWTEPGVFSTVGRYSLDLFGSRATANLRIGRTLLVNDVDAELAPDDGAGMFNQIGIKAIICCPLVADDDVDAADSLASLLQAGGHTVLTVYDGHEAVNRAPGFGPDLAFLDIGMPGMDGYQTARALRTLPQLAGLRLVALTGWGAPEGRARSREAGFDHHLLKPAAPEQLAQVLAHALASPGAEGDIGRRNSGMIRKFLSDIIFTAR